VWFGADVCKVLVNSRLAPARRRAALRILDEKSFSSFVVVTLAELS
jgi:hypothetical protein